MSTNLTKTEKQSVPRRSEIHPKVGNHHRNLNRSQSLEKIKRFNTYICSQNYYILPALLSWLKTSQTVLRSYAEKCIFFVKSLVYRTVGSPELLVRHVAMLIAKFYDSVTLVSEEVRLKVLAVAVYSAFLLIFSQLLACAYVLALAPIPGGLIFLLTAVSYISYVNYNCLRFILIKKELKEIENEGRCDNSASEKYIRPKNILGKRTISNLNLF